MTGYDLHRLTPQGATVEHVTAAAIETDGPWLFLRDTVGNATRCLPAHAVYDVRACTGGSDCGDHGTV